MRAADASVLAKVTRALAIALTMTPESRISVPETEPVDRASV